MKNSEIEIINLFKTSTIISGANWVQERQTISIFMKKIFQKFLTVKGLLRKIPQNNVENLSMVLLKELYLIKQFYRSCVSSGLFQVIKPFERSFMTPWRSEFQSINFTESYREDTRRRSVVTKPITSILCNRSIYPDHQIIILQYLPVEKNIILTKKHGWKLRI